MSSRKGDMMQRFYRVEAATFERVFRYLRRRPHEEVDGLLRAIAVSVEGPVSARRRKSSQRSGALADESGRAESLTRHHAGK